MNDDLIEGGEMTKSIYEDAAKARAALMTAEAHVKAAKAELDRAFLILRELAAIPKTSDMPRLIDAARAVIAEAEKSNGQ